MQTTQRSSVLPPENARPLETEARPRTHGIGVLGCGRFGRYMIESLAALPEIHLAALASRDESNLDAARAAWARGRQAPPPPGPAAGPAPPRAYHHWEALLDDPAVEVAVITAPPHLHAAMARAGLLAGKHLFLEKPGALAPEDLEVLGRLAAARKLAMAVNLLMRHNPIWRLVRDATSGGGPAGPLERACVENHAHGDLPPQHWFWDAGKSGGVFVEHGVHFFDLFNWLAGPARNVQATWLPNAAGGDLAPDRVLATAVHGAQDDAAPGTLHGAAPGGAGRDAALVTYYHAFSRPDGLGRAWAHLACDRGHLTVNGWTATELEAVLLADEAAEGFFRERFPEAGRLPGAEVTVEEVFPDGRRSFTARRRPFTADRRLRVRVHLGDADTVYRDCIRAGFRDLLRRAADPAHRPAGACVDDAARALRLAVAATRAAAAETTLTL